MEMGAQNPIKKIKPQGEIYTCPSCNYPDGFHVSFKISGDSPMSAEIILICPNCHERFRIDWNVMIG
jgi:predicted RNA-binding Zn-ribbon protein involved in translation (DUF1610 family)